MIKYNIGQMLTLSKDVELQGMLSDSKKVKKKGTKLFIGADKKLPMAMFLDGDINLLDKENTEIDGYSVDGLSEYIYIWLENRFPIGEMLEDYDGTKKEFKEVIADALEELGMYDNTGNRS